jgi:hypothetical protein
MNRAIFSLIVAAMTFVTFFPETSSAQEPQKGSGMNMPTFADIDRNEDGTITEEEFNKFRSERIAKHAQEGRKMKGLANAPSFAEIDLNGNDGIDVDEFSAHQAEHAAKRARHQ